MRPIIFIGIAFFLISCENLTNCIDGEGPLEVIERDISPFRDIELDLQGEYYLHSGNSHVTINVENNLNSYIETEVNNNKLDISTNGKCIDSDFLRFDIYNNEYSAITNNGSGNLYSDSIDFDPVIKSNGSGDIILTGNSDTQNVEVNGSGNINLTNMPTINAEIEVNGSGDTFVNVENDATVVINGSGDVTIENISGLLKVTINGSGDLYYSGNPSEVKITENGSGRVIEK